MPTCWLAAYYGSKSPSWGWVGPCNKPCYQTWLPDFDAQDPHGSTEPISTSCTLIASCTLWHVCEYTHEHTHKHINVINIFKESHSQSFKNYKLINTAKFLIFTPWFSFSNYYWLIKQKFSIVISCIQLVSLLKQDFQKYNYDHTFFLDIIFTYDNILRSCDILNNKC